MVGSRGPVRLLSALAGGTSRVLQIESLNEELIPESSPAGETPRRGLDDATLRPPATWTRHLLVTSLLNFELSSFLVN